jgi:hypothetical protein
MAVVVPELKFSDVERQILLADLVVAANDPALEDAPKAFNRVGVHSADNVFTLGVLDYFVRVQLLDVVIANPFVGHEKADFAGHRVHNELGEHVAADRVDYPRDDIALAAHSANHWHLAGTKAATSRVAASLAEMLVLSLAADECFIDFDHTTQFVEILFDQRGADAMTHIPSGLVRAETDIAMDLPSAHAFLAGQQQMDDAIPNPQIDVGILKDGPGNVGEPIAAGAAIRALPFEFHGLEFVRPVRATARANDAVWPAASDQISVAGILIGEGRFELGDGHLRNLLGLLAGHGGSPSRQGREWHV